MPVGLSRPKRDPFGYYAFRKVIQLHFKKMHPLKKTAVEIKQDSRERLTNTT